MYLAKLIDNMYYKLKALKTLKIAPNGCVFFESSIYLKIFKKYHFLKFNLLSQRPNEKIFFSFNSNSFHKKYINQIFKNLFNELTINC